MVFLGRSALAIVLSMRILVACGGSVDNAGSPDAGKDLKSGGDSGGPATPDACGMALPPTTCPAGLTMCGGACVDLSTNQDNCGACGSPCPSMDRCTQGTCTFLGCNAGLVICNHLCSVLNVPATCGSCTNTCPAGQVCSLEQCKPACSPGLVSCSGWCTDLSSDPLNCGACGTQCAFGCVQGQCVSTCPPSLKTCVAGCADVTKDPLNCGACSNACAPGESCAQGVCQPPCP
jgi:hypothetical protein